MKKRVLALLMCLVLLPLSAFAEEGGQRYVNPLTGAEYRLDSSDGSYLCTDPMESGSYIINEDRQTILFAPKSSPDRTMRFVRDTIYGGKAWNWYQSLTFPTFVYGVLGLEGFSIESAEKQKTRLSHARIVLKEDGGIYRNAIYSEENLTPEIIESYRAGWYEIVGDQFIVCVFSDVFLQSENADELHDMIFGLWTDEYGYTDVYFNVDSDLYKETEQACERLWKLKADYAPGAATLDNNPGAEPFNGISEETLDRYMKKAWRKAGSPRNVEKVCHLQFKDYTLDDLDIAFDRKVAREGHIFVFKTPLTEYVVLCDINGEPLTCVDRAELEEIANQDSMQILLNPVGDTPEERSEWAKRRLEEQKEYLEQLKQILYLGIRYSMATIAPTANINEWHELETNQVADLIR